VEACSGGKSGLIDSNKSIRGFVGGGTLDGCDALVGKDEPKGRTKRNGLKGSIIWAHVLTSRSRKDWRPPPPRLM